MNILRESGIPVVIRSEELEWDPEFRRFIGDMSGLPGGSVEITAPLNEGGVLFMQIRSRKTGNIEVFECSQADVYREDGDILYWTFHPTNPELAGVEVLIYND